MSRRLAGLAARQLMLPLLLGCVWPLGWVLPLEAQSAGPARAPAGGSRVQAGATPAGASGGLPSPPASPAGPVAPPLDSWLGSIADRVGAVEARARAGRLDAARQMALALYLDQYELLESTYGDGVTGGAALQAGIAAGEARFHELLQAGDAAAASGLAGALRAQLLALRPLAGRVAPPADGVAAGGGAAAAAPPVRLAARTPEIRRVLAVLDSARADYDAGRPAAALARVDRLYLDGIEPLESRLPQGRVHAIERLVHLGIRAGIGAGAPRRAVDADFQALRGRLLAADGLLGGGAPVWLGAANAFIILVREGLEAVLLIAALLAYLTASGAAPRERRRIYAGAGAGILATLATWVVARLVIPIGGGSRELVEGVTSLLAVAVLLYVSNWLFQKTYIHDWKVYLREHVEQAVLAGSGLAMAALAFAAVYREGFETVLFYQALLFDAGPGAVLAGALPGALLIGGIAVAIIRLGVKLPLRKVFAVTNGILLYLAFGFVGKGLYNLQEAGVFTPHALSHMPDSVLLRQLFGIFPIAETLAAQLLFLVLVAATYVYHRRRLAGPAREAASAPTPVRVSSPTPPPAPVTPAPRDATA